MQGSRIHSQDAHTENEGPQALSQQTTVKARTIDGVTKTRIYKEGTLEVDFMISDTRGLWHADMIRSAAAPPRDAKSVTGVLGLVLTTWRLASTDAARKKALGLHELECRRLQAGTLSEFVEYLCLATATGAKCRVVLGSRVTTHSNDLKAINSKKQIFGRAATRLTKSGPVEVKTHKLEYSSGESHYLLNSGRVPVGNLL